MKFTVLKSEFMRKLTPAMGTVSNKNTITSLEGVLLECMDDGLIRLSTYDMNKGFRSTFSPISTEEEGKVIINAARLYQTMKVMPEDEICFDIDENQNCTISCGKASFSMFSMRGEDYPNLPELTSDKGFKISAELLRKVILKVSHSVAEQDSRPMLCGAFFKITSSGIDVVSSDSFTLSKCRINSEVESIGAYPEVNYSFILPGHALGELSKVLSEGECDDVYFYVARRHIIIKKDDIVFFTRTIDSEYIDYERVIPKENDISVIIDREELLYGLERVNIIAEEKVQGRGRSYVKMIVDGHYLELTSSSVNGKVVDELDCVHEGGSLEIGFNCRFLINSVRAAEGEKIKITMKTPTSAITVECADEESDEVFEYLYMILPVRMSEN